MKLSFWAADRFVFTVTGPEVHRFLNRAAAAGVRLRHIRRQKDGCTAAADGADFAKLRQIAQEDGRTFAVVARRGPGHSLETLLRTRPGAAVGTVLFVLLLHFGGGFVWHIDWGPMDAALQPGVRQLLADCGIREGTRLTKPLLAAAQAQALRHSDVFGWISLNFAAGCLTVESTPAQGQTVRGEPPVQGLYARADGEILAVEIESGFALAEVGQTVVRGQALAAAKKTDRKGNAVVQGAAGRVTARVQKQYAAARPLTLDATVYTGRRTEQTALYLPGYTHIFAHNSAGEAAAEPVQVEWVPLSLGRLALPACLCRTTTWQRKPTALNYPEPVAAALAVRDCRMQLMREFPDAVIETEQRQFSRQGGEEVALVTYIFAADIAGRA